MKKARLEKELRLTGASPSEAERLTDLAEMLGRIPQRGLSTETKKRLAPTPEAARRRLRLPTWQWSLAGGFATACLLLIVAQSALPGSWLYGLKRKTEEARALVQPGFEDSLMEKREEEVQQLIIEKADPAVLEEAEKEFQQSVESSLDRWNQQDVPEESQSRFTPRYDWSREWYQTRGLVQGITDGLNQQDKDRGTRYNGSYR